MSGWSTGLEALRADFLREARGRIEQGRVLLERLGAGADADSRGEGLARVFHAFAGSGATFGFPEASDLGLEGERLCGAWRSEGRGPTADELQRAGALLERIEAGLALPPSQAMQAPPSAAAGEPPPPDVLLVEDDAGYAEALGGKLEREGFRVRYAGTLAAADEELRRRRPDAAIVDVVLPDGDVFPFVRRLRLLPGGESIPVLALTGRRGLRDRVEAIHAGVDAFFSKPSEADAVLARLRFLLQRETSEASRILSVEDDPQQAEYLRMVLESAGYAFRCCSDPAAVDGELSAFRPHLLLMDVVLPGISGYDLVRVLREDPRHALLPIVFLTTRAHAEDRIQASNSGGDDYLVKPVEPPLLLTLVAARIERARLLESLVRQDALTGLLTHGAFLDRAKALAQASATRRRRPAVLVMLDVDHFKQVNDRHGHVVGDRVLAGLGQLLRRRLRQSDVVGRYGGEEFALILEDLEAGDAARLTQRLLDEFAASEHAAPDGTRFRVTFSAGVAALESGMSAGDWCAAADRRLYEAKAGGRARVVAG